MASANKVITLTPLVQTHVDVYRSGVGDTLGPVTSVDNHNNVVHASCGAGLSTTSPGVVFPRDDENVEDFFDIYGCDQWDNPNWVNMCQEGDINVDINTTGEDFSGNAASVIYKRIDDWSDPELVVARAALIQDGGRMVDVRVYDDSFWENLCEYVSIDRSCDSCEAYSLLQGCGVPMGLVEVGKFCYLPVFDDCIKGTCACVYRLCGAVCQIKPCRFAAAVMGFGDIVSYDDLYVLTSACRGGLELSTKNVHQIIYVKIIRQ